MGSISRRALLLAGGAALAGRAATLLAQDSASRPRLGGEGDVGTLSDPYAVGPGRDPVTAKDNDARIRALELTIKCPCPCGLDVYTCRTTDFTCSYSPEAHREIIALWDAGKTPQQIADAFVAKYGERALMAPKPKGFNLAGYLVPGLALTSATLVMAAFLSRRKPAVSPAAPVADRPRVDASPAELERLRRELADSDP